MGSHGEDEEYKEEEEQWKDSMVEWSPSRSLLGTFVG